MVDFPIKWDFTNSGASYTSPHWQSAGRGSLRTVQIEVGQSESKYPTPTIKVKIVSQNFFQRFINAIAAAWNPAKYAVTPYWTSTEVFKSYPLPAPFQVPTPTSSKVDNVIQELSLFDKIWNSNLKDIDVNKLDQLQNFTFPAQVSTPPLEPSSPKIEISTEEIELPPATTPITEEQPEPIFPSIVNTEEEPEVFVTEEEVKEELEVFVTDKTSDLDVTAEQETRQLEKALVLIKDMNKKDDFEEGLLKLQELAEKEHVEAQYQLGEALLRALGYSGIYSQIEDEVAEQLAILAKTFLEKAAAKNHVKAQEHLDALNNINQH